MSAPISIVIPTLNAADALPGTANALLSGVGDGVIRELVVSDGGSTDETLTIARELGAMIVEGPRGRGGQIKRGVAAVTAPWVLILHADTHLSDGWSRVVRQHIAEAPDKAGWFLLRFRAAGMWPRVIEAGANLRSSLLQLPYGDQGLLVSVDLLEAVGGIPDLPLMEDVALARRLRGRLSRLDARAETSAERYERDGWVRRSALNLSTLARYAMGADPEVLARDYAKRK